MKYIFLAIAFVLATMTPAHALEYCSGGTSDTRSSTYLVGDSVSVYGKNDLPAKYEVNARARRSVDCLDSLLDKRKKAGNPKVVIIALGTNVSEGWTLADYRRNVDKFPKSVKVVLVTPYRDPAKHQYASVFINHYASWMRQLAKRDNVYLADWAAYANKHRSLLPDGTHPNKAGQKAWAKIIVRKVNA